MSESKKLLIGFAVLGFMCICVAGIGFFMFREFGKRAEAITNGDSYSVAKAQEEIANFKVPPGYEALAMDLFMYNLVTLSPDASNSGTTIMLMQLNNGSSLGNEEQTREQLRQVAEQQNGQAGSSMRVVDSFETVIRKETVTVTVSEGDYQSFTMRQWITIFDGNNGPTILMIQGPTSRWDDKLVEDFIKSIQ